MLTFFSCIGGGTLGGSKNFVFSCSRREVLAKMDVFLELNKEYELPLKYSEQDDWSEKGYDFLHYRLFYFKNDPEEIYYVSLVKNELDENLDSKPSNIAVRSYFDFKQKYWINGVGWKKEDKKRIEARFTKVYNELLDLKVDTVSTKKYSEISY